MAGEEEKAAPDAAKRDEVVANGGGSAAGGGEAGKQEAAAKDAETDLSEDLFGDADKKSDEAKGDAVSTGEEAAGKPEDEIEGLGPDENVPEKPFEGKVGDYNLKLPAGLKADNPQVQEFVKTLKASEVKGEKAQAILDMFIENRRRAANEMVAMDKQFRERMNEQWIAEIQADPEVGGKNFRASSNYAQALIRKFLTKEEILQHSQKGGKIGFLQMLNEGNIKNIPIYFKFMSRVGKYISEAQPVTTDAAPSKGNKPLTVEDALFGDL